MASFYSRDKYPPLPVLRYTDDILLYHKDGEDVGTQKHKIPSLHELKERTRKSRQQRMSNGDMDSEYTLTDDEQLSYVSEDERSVKRDSSIPPAVEDIEQEETVEEKESEVPTIEEPTEENGDDDNTVNKSSDDHGDILSPIPETVEENKLFNETNETTPEPEMTEEFLESEVTEDTSALEPTKERLVNGEIEDSPEIIEGNEANEPIANEDDVLNEIHGKANDSLPQGEEDNILDSILSDDGQNLESSEANNER